MTKSLVGIATYESPKHVRKFEKRSVEPDEDFGEETIENKFKTSIDLSIIEWLELSTLGKINKAIPGHDNTDYSYFFKGETGAFCTIHPERIDFKGGPDELIPEDHEYKWEVYVRYQPINAGIPAELEYALLNLGFKKKEEENLS